MMTFDEPFDDELKLLALEVQRQPPLTPKRQLALNKLLQGIQQPSEVTRLKRSQRAKYSRLTNELFQDVFDEALQETLIAISRSIDNYNPQQQLFISWVMGIVNNKFSDVYRKYSRQGLKFIPNSKSQHQKPVQIISFDGLEEFVVDFELEKSHSYKENLAKEKLASDCEFIRELLIKDPDNKFQKHIKGKPELTFQYIAKALYIEGINMNQLSKKLNLTNSTLTSFYSRELARLKPYFQEKL